MISADIDLERIELERIRFRSFAQGVETKALPPHSCGADALGTLGTVARQRGFGPFIPENADRRRERAREILRMQCAGLTERLRKTGIARVVIGVSGGLDSTLALLVAAAAMDELRTSAFGHPRHLHAGLWYFIGNACQCRGTDAGARH